MDALAPGERHHVRVDAGHIKLNYQGWRYIADTPGHVKRSLMLFDKGLYEDLRTRTYSLRFRRTTKIVPLSAAQLRQKNATRLEGIARGNATYRKKYNLRTRIEGFSGIV